MLTTMNYMYEATRGSGSGSGGSRFYHTNILPYVCIISLHYGSVLTNYIKY